MFVVKVQNDSGHVKLKTKSTTPKITRTVIDNVPLAVYSIDKVLLPKELIN